MGINTPEDYWALIEGLKSGKQVEGKERLKIEGRWTVVHTKNNPAWGDEVGKEVLLTPPDGKLNLLTNAGRDFACAQAYGTPGAAAQYIALSTNTGGASTSHTSLADEIATGGLERAIGAYAHTGGTATCTISKTFTASATHTAVQLGGLFNASSSGTLVHENTFTAATLLSGDTLAVTVAITVSYT